MANNSFEMRKDNAAFNEESYFEHIYIGATNTMNNSSSAIAYKEAARGFNSIKEYKDSARLARICMQKAESIQRRKRIFLTSLSVVVLIAVIAVILILEHFAAEVKYNDAIELMNDGKYTEAIYAFEGLNGYKDSEKKLVECENAFLVKMQSLVDGGDYAKFVLNTRYLSERYFSHLASGLHFSPAQQGEFYQYILNDYNITSIPSFCNEVSKNKKYFELISSYSDAQNIMTLYGIFERSHEYNYDYIKLFKTNMKDIVLLWNTEFIRTFFTSDDIIAYYMNGEWREFGNQENYLMFYHKSGTSANLTTCNYSLPCPEVEFAYWDMQNLELVFLDNKRNVVAKAYKIEFIDANTINVYAYQNAKTYTLTRQFAN